MEPLPEIKSRRESIIKEKQILIYEIALKLGLNPENLDNLQIPEESHASYNMYVFLKKNIDIVNSLVN